MNKITPEHLAREAYVYVRQSTADQLLNNPESRRRQYALVARARALGWENAIVIDDDLGRSGDGQLRPGFERLLAAICAGTVGAVLAIEASRLAVPTDYAIRRMVGTSLECGSLCGASPGLALSGECPHRAGMAFLYSSPQAEPGVQISRTGLPKRRSPKRAMLHGRMNNAAKGEVEPGPPPQTLPTPFAALSLTL